MQHLTKSETQASVIAPIYIKLYIEDTVLTKRGVPVLGGRKEAWPLKCSFSAAATALAAGVGHDAPLLVSLHAERCFSGGFYALVPVVSVF